MFTKRIAAVLLALCLVAGLTAPAYAAEVDCDATYCFSDLDFYQEGEAQALAGICITGLPDSETGTVMLGTRVLRSGDILTAEQLSQLTFSPLLTEEDRDAVMTYLPIYEDHVAASTTMTLCIRGKEDKAPVAEDFAIETYKNLPNQGTLKVTDPEGQSLTYTITRQPRRGTVVINEDGTFTYTPKKNKVGTDSFTFTATDPAGNVSREATVTVKILKPTDASQYTDTVGEACRFEAEWLKNTGIFTGETLAGEVCFQPDKTVTCGEFLTMLIRVLEIPADETVWSSVPSDTPDWLKPYVAAAIRSGLTAGLEELTVNEPITGAQAAVMIQNALDLTVSTSADLTQNAEEIPAWAVSAINALADNGITLNADTSMTRAQAAMVLYQVNTLAEDAPGMITLRAQ